MKDTYITLKLRTTNALVLEAFLIVFSEQEAFEALPLVDKLVVSDLHGVLEHSIDELFDPDYNKLLEMARLEVIDRLVGQ